MIKIDEKTITKDKLEFLLNHATDDGWEFQKRRHDDWRENKELFRNKVIVNRLTQRQSVNLPLMKQIVKTLLSKIDDFIDLVFTNLDNDKQRELFYNLHWTDVVKPDNHLELKDKVDKKQVMLCGRSFEKLNVSNGKVKIYIVDPLDIRIDRFTDPTDIDTANALVQDNIFETLGDLRGNSEYDQTVVDEIESFFKTEQGLKVMTENQDKLTEKNQAAQEMGDTYVNNPQLGQALVQMQEGFLKVYNPATKSDEYVFTLSGAIRSAEGKTLRKILYADWLENVIDPQQKCKDHFWRYHLPFESWGEDLEAADFWNDAPADSVRAPNKVVNAWFSQEVENRTLRNLGMNYYNSNQSGEDQPFIPQTFEPKAFGWYPIPGNPNELIKSVEIPELKGNLEEINFVIQVAEKASAATAITQGVSEQKKITLGEVELLAGNALDRIQSMSIYYQHAWLNIGRKYVKLMEAQADNIDAVKLFKKGYQGNVFSKTITPAMWKSRSGYDVQVISKKDKSEQDLEQMNKLNAVKTFMPMNQALNTIMKKKLLDIGGLNPDEVKEIMAEEEQRAAMPMVDPATGLPMQPAGQPTQPALPAATPAPIS